MAGRSSTTFKKRQKELARQDKQARKSGEARQRKQHKDSARDRTTEPTFPTKDDPFGADAHLELGRGPSRSPENRAAVQPASFHSQSRWIAGH